MEGKKESSPLIHREEPTSRELKLYDRSGSSHAVDVIESLQERLEDLQARQPETVRETSIYTQIEDRRLVVQLGVVGIHAELYSVAKQANQLMKEEGIGLPFGPSWKIDH